MSEGVEIQLDALLSAALDSHVWQIHDPAALSTWKKSPNNLLDTVGDTRGGFRRVGKEKNLLPLSIIEP
jgi:hypothetical protein